MEQALSNPKVGREDTELVAGHKLGVQTALQYIREHFLVT